VFAIRKVEYVAAIKSVADIAFHARAGLVFLGPGDVTTSD